MTLPASGPISFNAINVELGQPGATTANINQASYRTLAGIPTSGTTISLSNFYGKSNRVAISYTFTASTANASLNVAAIGGYSAGKSDITVTVNPSVYLYSTSVPTPGLTLSGGTTGDTLTLVNNGFIMGQGGNNTGYNPGSPGGTALQLGYPTTVNNTNGSAYIGGGGGSGGGDSAALAGGGGAGGGSGGGTGAGGAGGGIGASGSNGGTTNGSYPGVVGSGGGAGGGGGRYYSTGGGRTPLITAYGGGGGGGRIFPGSGGAGGTDPTYGFASGSGGSANGSGGSSGPFGSGGGGGWGASGGAGYSPTGSAGGGGKAVNLNGKTITWTSGNTTRVYGSVS